MPAAALLRAKWGVISLNHAAGGQGSREQGRPVPLYPILSVGPALESEVKVEGMSSGTEEQPEYALAEKVSAAHVLTRGSGIAL